MNTTDKKIAEVLAKFGEPMAGNVWRVQGTAVIYHKALERIAAQAQIQFDTPTIVRAERDEAVILVAGRMGERLEWSIGEALIGVNYRVSGKQAAYVYAMAEKRAKDRLIYKFLGLEEQFDDSAASQGDSANKNEPSIHQTTGGAAKPTSEMTIAQKLRHNIGRKVSLKELDDYLATDPVKMAMDRLNDVERGEIEGFINLSRGALATRATSRSDDTIWAVLLAAAKAALSKGKNESEVNSYESMMKEQEFADAPADVLEGFRSLCEARRYELRTK
jgi:hypothetical protein